MAHAARNIALQAQCAVPALENKALLFEHTHMSCRCRPSAATGAAPDWLTASSLSVTAPGGSSQSIMRPAGHINEAREAVLLAARQLGAAPVKAAAAAMSGLQVGCVVLCVFTGI